ncbi:hypothetical protein ACFZA1_36525 [Streptomyces filipinensis]|uniref:hypothetical protein n=1 Tax=Streptomyces filipinensis TaxID=66887 RepID=UPI0036EF42F5
MVAVVGVVGTLLCALLTQRAADRSRRREREHTEQVRERRGHTQELHAWADAQGVPGRAVLPGTVAATGAGALADRGVRRIYHAAVAVSRAGTNDYDVLPSDVTRATSRPLAVLAEEHARFLPPLRSVCLPLLGSGRGGLPYAVSLAAVWAAVEAESARGAGWDVHFVVRTPESAAQVERIPAGIRPAPDRRAAR